MNIVFNLLFKLIFRLHLLYNKIKSKYLGLKFKRIGTNPFFISPLYTHCANLIVVGNNFHVERGTRLECHPTKNDNSDDVKLKIGNNVYINWNCHIGAANYIEIQDNVLIGSNVLIIDHSHGDSTICNLKLPPNNRPIISKGSVLIEKNVWIGENVCILPGVKIGESSIIGAGSIVTKSFPANCIIAGNPAKIVKKIG